MTTLGVSCWPYKEGRHQGRIWQRDIKGTREGGVCSPLDHDEVVHYPGKRWNKYQDKISSQDWTTLNTHDITLICKGAEILLSVKLINDPTVLKVNIKNLQVLDCSGTFDDDWNLLPKPLLADANTPGLCLFSCSAMSARDLTFVSGLCD